MRTLPKCPLHLPDDPCGLARKLAEAWFRGAACPRVQSGTLSHWSRLIEDWIANAKLPLYVRKPNKNRGTVLEHATGRKLVPVDNSPATWALTLALQDQRPSMREIEEMVRADQIPVAMALKAEEKETATYHCLMESVPLNLNALGWKVCHIDKVSLKHRDPLETCVLATIVDHFRRFLSPSNMFVVPKAWAGLGELPDVIDVARQLMADGAAGGCTENAESPPSPLEL